MENTNVSRKARSVAFTGHRHYDYSEREEIKVRMKEIVQRLYNEGKRRFLCGMAVGTDLLFAEVITELAPTNPDMRLIAVVPFAGQDARYGFYERSRYKRLIGEADEVIVLSKYYYPRCFLDRDDYLVRNVSELIAYYDGRGRSGTGYTVRVAEIANIPITNIYTP